MMIIGRITNTRGRRVGKVMMAAAVVGAAALLRVGTSAAAACAGNITSLGSGANGLTVFVSGCDSACPGGLDSYPTSAGMSHMLAHLLTAQARGAGVTLSYNYPGSVPGRC